MKPVYFKLRARFDCSPHAYEVGRPLVQNMAIGMMIRKANQKDLILLKKVLEKEISQQNLMLPIK